MNTDLKSDEMLQFVSFGGFPSFCGRGQTRATHSTWFIYIKGKCWTPPKTVSYILLEGNGTTDHITRHLCSCEKQNDWKRFVLSLVLTVEQMEATTTCVGRHLFADVEFSKLFRLYVVCEGNSWLIVERQCWLMWTPWQHGFRIGAIAISVQCLFRADCSLLVKHSRYLNCWAWFWI